MCRHLWQKVLKDSDEGFITGRVKFEDQHLFCKPSHQISQPKIFLHNAFANINGLRVNILW